MVFSGLIVDRTGGMLTIVDANGNQQQIPESDVDYEEPSSQSTMPMHLLQSLTAAEAADLLQYLRSLSAPHVY